MKTNSVLQLSFLAVLTRTDALWRSRPGVCRGTGGDYRGFPGCSSIRVLFVPSRVSSAAAASRAELCFVQPTARVVFNLCLSARHRVPCHGTSLTWAIALLSAYRGRKEQGKLGGNKQQKPLWLWLQGVCFFVVRSVSVNQSYCLFICLFSSKMFWFISCWYFVRLFKLC